MVLPPLLFAATVTCNTDVQCSESTVPEFNGALAGESQVACFALAVRDAGNFFPGKVETQQ